MECECYYVIQSYLIIKKLITTLNTIKYNKVIDNYFSITRYYSNEIPHQTISRTIIVYFNIFDIFRINDNRWDLRHFTFDQCSHFFQVIF